MIRLGHILAFIIQVQERESMRRGKLFHLFRRILRIGLHIVAADGDKMYAMLQVFICHGYDGIDHMQHIRAVVADKHHYGCLLAFDFLQRKHFSAHGIREIKVRRLVAKRNAQSFSCCHGLCFEKIVTKLTVNFAPIKSALFMNRQELSRIIRERQSYLCIGLDTDPGKIPQHLLSLPDPVFAFNKAIIDATKDLCVSYKINTAFYESGGVPGWQSLEKTVAYIPENTLKIADAKRGDIGNTSHQYAKTFFEVFDFDAVTVAPYMGRDSVEPFLQYSDKWTILLGLTSNDGSLDFQMQKTADGEYFYEKVLQRAAQWGTPDNLMFVIGATRESQIGHIRSMLPEHFFLVPGVGAQGGNLGEISRLGLNHDGGLLINASRSVIYAGKDKDFAEAARQAALQLQTDMKGYLAL